MNAPTYRVALLSNAMHQDMYARAFDRHQRLEVAIVAEETGQEAVIRERGRRLAADLKVPHTTNVRAVLVRPDIDVVSVCAEIERRGRLAEMVAKYGKHLWMDKPLAPRLDRCDAIVAAARKTGIRSLVFNQLDSGYVQVARKAIDEGAIGDLVALHVDFHFAKGDPDMEAGAGPVELSPLGRWTYRSDDLWSDPSGSGHNVAVKRELFELGVYPVGIVRHLARREVRRVQASAGNYFFNAHAEHGAEDFATLSLTMDDCIATISVGRIGRHSHPESGSKTIHAVGTAGTLVVDASRQAMTVCSSDGGSPRTESVAMHEVAGVDTHRGSLRACFGRRRRTVGRRRRGPEAGGDIAGRLPVYLDRPAGGVAALGESRRGRGLRVLNCVAMRAWQPHRRTGAVHPSDPK